MKSAIAWHRGDDGVVAFSGLIHPDDIDELGLDDRERATLTSPVTSPTDFILCLAILFRRGEEREGDPERRPGPRPDRD